ncbi:hypothetical protein DPMN_041275 [Dreissena polymorpha]|uniref:Uncharacterized protein n=1 Tax=Dreissena polymorpha TaxID=45954 RepID=A0A9D4CZ19_DREPO|nr:hypothetical protein DPMN_041275 [Dreissena polymorpha]
MAISTPIKALFLLQVASLGLCTIELCRLENKTFEGFECISKNDIIIKFINHTSNATHIFAECLTDLKGCYLTAQSLGNKYAVFYTGSGGQFYINTFVDKSHGSYSCCEKYDSQLCLSTQFVTENTTTNNSDWDIPKQINISSDQTTQQSKESYAVLVVISTILCISVTINVLFVCHQIRKKGCITLERLMCGKGKILNALRDERDSWVEVRPVHSADFKLLMKMSDIKGTQLNS